MNSQKKKTISELGKHGLIRHLTAGADVRNNTTKSGIGHDSAVIDNGNSLTLASTDLLLEGIHFNLVYTPLKHLGYKAVVRAISDIYAMNGIPGQVLVAVGLSSRFSLENIEEIYDGIKAACEKYKIDLAGGDTTSSMTGLTLSVTAIGKVAASSLVRSDGAQANDLVCVTGNFGAAYMGLQILERERALFEKENVSKPDFGGYEYIIGRQLKPELPYKTLGDLEAAAIRPTSMTDVTEGLASDLIGLCRMSQTGCRVYYSKIPVDYETAKAAEEFNIDPVTAALNGGEDYEFLFTVPLTKFDAVSAIEDVRIIGHMTAAGEGCILAGDDGSEVRLSAQGWRD